MTKKYIFSFSKFFIILALILNTNIFTEANPKGKKNHNENKKIGKKHNKYKNNGWGTKELKFDKDEKEKERIIKEKIQDQGYDIHNFKNFLNEKKGEKELNCEELEEEISSFCKKENNKYLENFISTYELNRDDVFAFFKNKKNIENIDTCKFKNLKKILEEFKKKEEEEKEEEKEENNKSNEEKEENEENEESEESEKSDKKSKEKSKEKSEEKSESSKKDKSSEKESEKKSKKKSKKESEKKSEKKSEKDEESEKNDLCCQCCNC